MGGTTIEMPVPLIPMYLEVDTGDDFGHVSEIKLPAVPRVGDAITYSPDGVTYQDAVLTKVAWDATAQGDECFVVLIATREG